MLGLLLDRVATIERILGSGGLFADLIDFSKEVLHLLKYSPQP